MNFNWHISRPPLINGISVQGKSWMKIALTAFNLPQIYTWLLLCFQHFFALDFSLFFAILQSKTNSRESENGNSLSSQFFSASAGWVLRLANGQLWQESGWVSGWRQKVCQVSSWRQAVCQARLDGASSLWPNIEWAS